MGQRLSQMDKMLASWDRKRLQQSEELLRPLAENIDLVLWMRAIDSDQIIYASPAYERIWGQTRESLYHDPRSLTDAIHPEDRERVLQAMREHEHGGLREEFRLVGADGSLRWILARTFLTAGPGASGALIAGVAQDITEQKKAEDKLRVTLANMRERYMISRRIGAAHTAEEVVVALRSLSLVTNASRVAVLVFDKPWQDGMPQEVGVLVDWRESASMLTLMADSPSPRQLPLASLLTRDGAVLVNDVERDVRLSSDARVWLAALDTRGLLIFPLIASGQWYGILTIHFGTPVHLDADDINYTEKVVNQAAAAIYNFHLLEAETRARIDAEEANELKLKFLAMISHELRTPLTSIKGFATTLLADDVTWDTHSQHDFIETISQEADKLTDLIDHLLDLSRLESGTLRIILEDQPLNAIMETAMAQLQALSVSHRLVIAIPEDRPLVRADAQRVSQVLTNLVSNAAKYAPPETEIRIATVTRGTEVEVSVSDEGPGIAPAERSSVFEAFYQPPGRDGPGSQVAGAGLGLAICKGLVEAHGGRIWVVDQAGPRTTMSFTLPLAEPAQAKTG